MGCSHADTRKRITLVVDGVDEHPDLILDVHDGAVSFEIRDEICLYHGLTHMTFDGSKVRADDSELLLSILQSAAHFYWHLRHSGEDTALMKKIQFECFELEPTGKLTDDLDEIMEPKRGGGNLISKDGILLEGDKLKASYGFSITSTVNPRLYAALFCFNIRDLAITAYHVPAYASKGNADPCIPGKSSLALGFGDGGCPPRRYYVEDKNQIDISFVKLYVFTEYVDLSDIPQDPPIPVSRADKPFKAEPKGLWGTLTIPIIQRLKG
ncbi:hypothetical protein H0H92_010256 [Tricholoma furcatifolium]|nr:hypothetical protein H0H92_010256 [Tricholoma furcatifolium]